MSKDIIMYSINNGYIGLSRYCCPFDGAEDYNEIEAIKRDLMEDNESRLIFIDDYLNKNLHRHINCQFSAYERFIAVELQWSVFCKSKARKIVLSDKF